MSHILFFHQERTRILFNDPIGILMDEFLESQFQPCHDFIPHCLDLSLNFKQVRMNSIFNYITFKPSLACWVINCKESSMDSFSKWLHWIYDFT